jgi:deoxyribose-phosphate aldolase
MTPSAEPVDRGSSPDDRRDLDPARIDHTSLGPDAVARDIAQLCAEARDLGFKTVCVQPVFVAFAASRLAGSPVGVSAVVAFPHGASTTSTKVHEARVAVADGATELDVVANLGWIRDGDGAAIERETRALVEAAGGRAVKVILETSLFSADQIAQAARAALAGGAAFLKTSTGFAAGGGGGATLEHVALLRAIAGGQAGVKASGGIRTRAQALAMLAAGADRLGCSASVALVRAGAR